MIGLDPTDAGADQLTVTDSSFGLSPVTDGALGESPKVSALVIVAEPAVVWTVTSTDPPVLELGLTKVSVVPSLLSVQLDTEATPTVTPVTPTRKEPFSVTFAPPVFGIRALLVLIATGD